MTIRMDTRGNSIYISGCYAEHCSLQEAKDKIIFYYNEEIISKKSRDYLCEKLEEFERLNAEGKYFEYKREIASIFEVKRID